MICHIFVDSFSQSISQSVRLRLNKGSFLCLILSPNGGSVIIPTDPLRIPIDWDFEYLFKLEALSIGSRRGRNAVTFLGCPGREADDVSFHSSTFQPP